MNNENNVNRKNEVLYSNPMTMPKSAGSQTDDTRGVGRKALDALLPSTSSLKSFFQRITDFPRIDMPEADRLYSAKNKIGDILTSIFPKLITSAAKVNLERTWKTLGAAYESGAPATNPKLSLEEEGLVYSTILSDIKDRVGAYRAYRNGDKIIIVQNIPLKEVQKRYLTNSDTVQRHIVSYQLTGTPRDQEVLGYIRKIEIDNRPAFINLDEEPRTENDSDVDSQSELSDEKEPLVPGIPLSRIEEEEFPTPPSSPPPTPTHLARPISIEELPKAPIPPPPAAPNTELPIGPLPPPPQQ